MEGAPPLPTESTRSPEGLPTTLDVRPWLDELVEAHGYGPRSMYVETCWLPVLGPTATWLYRRLGSWAEFNPDGLTIDTTDLSVSLGLGEGLGLRAQLARSLERLVRFDVARFQGDVFEVRRALAPLPQRHVDRLSYSSRRLHDEITRRTPPAWEQAL
jgi:hypothetical protein